MPTASGPLQKNPLWRAASVFRVLAAGITVDPPGATYGPRRLQHFELIWLMEGNATAHFDGTQLHAQPGALLLRRPGVTDFYEWSTEQRTVHAFVHFDLDKPRQKLYAGKALPTLCLPPPNDILRPLLGYILDLAEQREPLRSRLMLPALDLLLKAYAAGRIRVKPAPAQPLPAPVAKALEAAQQRLRQDPTHPIQLGELAAAANTTPVNLCRLFKRALNLGPLEYVRMVRLDQAANQLRRSALSLKEIALATGFYDGNHLAKHFKQVYGLSPLDFRKAELNEWLTQRNPIIRMLYRPSDRALTR